MADEEDIIMPGVRERLQRLRLVCSQCSKVSNESRLSATNDLPLRIVFLCVPSSQGVHR